MTNVDEQHEELLAYLEPYWDEITAWRKRARNFIFLHPIKFVTLVLPAFASQARQTPVDPLSGRTNMAIASIARLITEPTCNEAQRQAFEDLLADFSIHVIAERVVQRFPEYEFTKIKKLHDARRSERLKLTATKLVAGALTATAFVSKSVPKGVIEQDLGWKYEKFEVYLFYVTFTLLGYFGLIVFSEWYALRRSLVKHEFFGRILLYLELATSSTKA